MTFEYVIPIIGNDFYGDRAPYEPQIPILLSVKYNLSTSVSTPYLRWTLYWYEYVDGQLIPQRKYKRYDRWNLGTGARSWTGYVELLESDMNLDKFANAVTAVQSKDFRLLIEIFNAPQSTQVLESAEYNFNIGGRHKYAVDWAFPQFTPYTNSTYPLIGESSSFNGTASSYNSRDSGTPLIWSTQYDKIDAGKWFKLMLIVVGQFGDEPIDLDVAIDRGFISNGWRITNSSINIDRSYFPPFRYMCGYSLTGGFLAGGDYKFVIAYYEKNDTELPGYYTLRTMESSQFRIYKPFAGANMHISSIIPAEYKEGDSDPNNGMPPFSVTVADDTVRDGFTVPLSSITIEWGDPDSGVNNAWSILEPGTSQITIPPHSYNGYGPYNILMTCVDKRGGTTTKSIQFAPSKVPRIMKSPTLNGTPSGSVISLSYPALMQGEAFNAGLPTPTTTWEYTFQSDPGYYSGERTGDYVEFSLLAEGTYSVTATIANSGITIGTYSWTVNVGAEPVSTSNDKQMPDYALIVLDASGQPLDRCKQHTCPNYSENFQGLDTVSFELPADYQYADHLKEGDYFLFGMRGARLMQVAYRSQKNNILTITGECVFPVRVAIYATRSTASDGYDVQTCSAEALIRYFVHTALSDPYNSQPRSADFWMHGTNQDLPTNGAQVTYSARYDNILDIVNSVCKTSGIGYSIAVRDVADSLTSVQMTVREGTNRTYATGGAGAVIFSEKLKNCIINSDQSAVSSNVAIGAGEGVGYIREYSYYDKDGNQNPTTTGFNRRELFVDAGDSADTSEQKRISVYQLREEQALSISLQVLPACQWKFGTDYRVGDTVSVWLESRGGLVDLQIYSADCVLRESGEELHLHLGSRVQTAPALIASNERKNTYARK